MLRVQRLGDRAAEIVTQAEDHPRRLLGVARRELPLVDPLRDDLREERREPPRSGAVELVTNDGVIVGVPHASEVGDDAALGALPVVDGREVAEQLVAAGQRAIRDDGAQALLHHRCLALHDRKDELRLGFEVVIEGPL